MGSGRITGPPWIMRINNVERFTIHKGKTRNELKGITRENIFTKFIEATNLLTQWSNKTEIQNIFNVFFLFSYSTLFIFRSSKVNLLVMLSTVYQTLLACFQTLTIDTAVFPN